MIHLEDARRIIAAAEKKAKEIGQPMNIAVADAGGNLVAHVRMDGAWIGSIDISIKKAYTSRAFDISTKDLATHQPVWQSVLWHSCFERWQDHDFCGRHSSEARWQSCRRSWCQRRIGRAGPRRCRSWGSSLLDV